MSFEERKEVSHSFSHQRTHFFSLRSLRVPSKVPTYNKVAIMANYHVVGAIGPPMHCAFVISAYDPPSPEYVSPGRPRRPSSKVERQTS